MFYLMPSYPPSKRLRLYAFGTSLTALIQFGVTIVALFTFLLIYRWDEVAFTFGRHHVKRLAVDYVYDFVIIGAGSAGSVLASRLSEVPEWKVLLLEAGAEENIFADIPGLAMSTQLTPYDWKLRPEPQSTACLAYRGNRCSWPQGKALGGTSVINYMLYVRGNRRDYDAWAAAGNTDWHYENVLYYFKKSEDNQNPEYAAPRFHGTGGYLTVGEAPWHSPLNQVYLDAASEMGYEVGDRNGANQTGFMTPQGTIRDGLRCSTAKAFLKPARERPNLHVADLARVLRVLFAPGTRRAVGVEVNRFGRTFNILARKEVILSAGALKSPQLLMLSGIGPAYHLTSLGLPVVADLPAVGQNLQDHIGFGGLFFLIDKPWSFMYKNIFTIREAFRFAKHQQGPFTTLGGIEALGFVKSRYADQNDDYPDIEFIIASGSIVSDGGLQTKRNYGIRDDIWNEYFAKFLNKHTFAIMPTLLRPSSRGFVQLKSANPFDSPTFYHNYLTQEEDIKVLVDGVKLALKMAKTRAMKKIGTRLPTVPFPGCEHFVFGSDKYWECAIRHMTFSFWHFIGTCQMGPDAATAVVSQELKVHGIDGLRVVDASVMPLLPTCHANAPTIMIAEKAADMIKSTWGMLHAH